VAWAEVTRPTELRGLGVIDLTTLGYALRLRWEWLARAEPDRLASSFCNHARENHPASNVQNFSHCQLVGDGNRTMFWKDRWLQGKAIKGITPKVVAAVSKHNRNTRTVATALCNSRWISDIVWLVVHHGDWAVH
jgi:hypothetical protein